MNSKQILAHYRELLEANKYDDVGIVPYMMRELPEVIKAGLDDLAQVLSRDTYCCYNDVTGFLDLLEKWIEENETP